MTNMMIKMVMMVMMVKIIIMAMVVMMVKIIIMVMVSYNRVTPLWSKPYCWQPGKQN